MFKQIPDNRHINSRYGEDFKQTAICMVVEGKIPIKQAAANLNICIGTLRYWIRKDRNKKHNRILIEKINNLETEICSLTEIIDHKNKVIDTLKKSIGIISNL